MKIKRMDAGRGQSRRVLYDLTNEEAIVARFSSLEEAALVLRYMVGGNMTEEAQERALEALKAIDERGGAYNG